MERTIQFFIILLLLFIYAILFYRIVKQKGRHYFRENIILILIASAMILIDRFEVYMNVIIGVLNLSLLAILIKQYWQESNK